MEEFEFLDDAGTGDVVLAVHAHSLEGLFRTAARGLFAAMVSTKEIQLKDEIQIRLSAESLDLLLFQWLSELIYLKDAEQRFFNDFKITLTQASAFKLHATAMGEKIDPTRHRLKNDVKAVTFHRFSLEKKSDAWHATIIFDI